MSDHADEPRQRPSEEHRHRHHHHRTSHEERDQSEEDSRRDSLSRKRHRKHRRKDTKSKRRRQHKYDSSSSSVDYSRKDRKRKRNHKRRKNYESDSSHDDRRKKSKKSKRKKRKRQSRDEESKSDPAPTKQACVEVSDKEPNKDLEQPASMKESHKREPEVKQRSSVARARQMAPMSREQYEQQQSVVREIYDEETGRYRLVRGTGEIIERIVSRSDHERINENATRGDGSSFARNVFSAANRPFK